ncbi:MAG: chromosome partitioning protein ParB [Candidatus Aminicenantes bacterium]|jgi:hypothetical protein
MVEEVEISSFDLRYQSYRMKNPTAEKALLTSILEHGIREPLQGVDSPDSSVSSGSRILLNGFKRYRCAQKLSIKIAPYSSLGNDEAFGIITLLRIANSKNLTILEQAKLIDELYKVHKLSVAEMAQLLEKSKGWISMRLGMIEQMSEVVMEKIFKGQFPAYSYMYSIRPFMRMNETKKKEIEEFVCLTSGKDLSTREVDLLARGYFSGGDDFREQLKNGDISWVLSNLMEKEKAAADDCTQLERRALRELESLRYSMGKITYHSSDSRLKSPAFLAQANSLLGNILKQMASFTRCLEIFYDRIRKT